MKDTFLYVACWVLVILAMESIWMKFVVVLLGSIYGMSYYGKKFCKTCMIVIIFIVYTLFPIQKEELSNTVQIQEIHTNYVIANTGTQNVILFHVTDVDILDIIEIDGEYEDVYSQKNLGTYQFETTLKQKGIYKSMYVKSYIVKHKSNHLRAKMYRYIQQKDTQTKEILNAILYRNYHGEKENIVYASGMHLYFLANVLHFITRMKKEYWNCIVSVVMFLCFPVSSSIVCMMISSIVSIFFTDFNKEDRLGISILLLLVYNPLIYYEISFQLTFLFRFIHIFDRMRKFSYINTYLILIPFQLYYFQECYLFEIILFPCIRFFYGCTFLSGILSLCIDSFTSIFIYLNQWCILFDIWITSTFSMIAKPYVWWLFAWIYACIKWISYNSKNTFFSFLILLLVHILMPYMTPWGEVSFLDVGQGDCILIKEPFNGDVMMIDVAGKKDENLVEKRIYPYLKSRGIRKIDKVVITHEDYDHSGGLKALQECIEVVEVIYDVEDFIDLKYLRFYNLNQNTYEEENEKSLILFVQIGDLNYLFTGDASKQNEADILEKYNRLHVDVLKVGHHGSNTSSDLLFLQQIHPKISVISSGKNNFYGHPHKEVIDRLQKVNSYIVNTQENGSIHIFFTSFINLMITGRYEFGIIK